MSSNGCSYDSDVEYEERLKIFMENIDW